MKWIIAGLMVFASAAAHADTLASPDAVREFTDKVMEKVSAGDLDGGFAMMKKYSIVAGAEMDALAAKVKRSQSVVSPVYGKSIGHELIKMDTLGTSAIRIIQLQKFENHPVHWTFIFYRGTGWTLDNLDVSDDVKKLFGAS